MKNIAPLRETVHALREETYPDLPPELVDEVLRIEAESEDDRSRARDLVRKAVAERVAAIPSADDDGAQA